MEQFRFIHGDQHRVDAGHGEVDNGPVYGVVGDDADNIPLLEACIDQTAPEVIDATPHLTVGDPFVFAVFILGPEAGPVRIIFHALFKETYKVVRFCKIVLFKHDSIPRNLIFFYN